MKKLNFMAIAMLTIGLFVFTSCDKDDNFVPDPVFVEALMARYPDARVDEWERKRGYIVAECYVGYHEMDVWFDTSAQWVMTETNVARAELPAEVLDGLSQSNYANWRVDDIDKLEYSNGTTVYVIEVEQGNREIDLYFSVTGELTGEIDVTNSDDTHYPL